MLSKERPILIPSMHTDGGLRKDIVIIDFLNELADQITCSIENPSKIIFKTDTRLKQLVYKLHGFTYVPIKFPELAKHHFESQSELKRLEAMLDILRSNNLL